MNNDNSENHTFCQKFKHFFNNIDCFLQCVFSDLETEQHTEIQQIEIEESPQIQKSIKIDESPKIDYGVEIEPYIESEIDEKNHVFTVKKNNQMYNVVGRESIKI